MTSGPRFVKPQAICWLWPITTPGRPEKVKPETSKGQSSDSVVQCRPIWYQMPGIETCQVRVVGQDRLAGRGVVAVDDPRVGAEAVALAEHRRQVLRSTARCTRSRARSAAPEAERRRDGLRVPPRVASCSKTLSTTAPWSTIGPVPVVGVRREQLGDLLGRPGRRHQAALDLVVHVAAQVPRHRLEPGDGVRRRPVLDLVVGVLQAEHGVLQRDLRRRVRVRGRRSRRRCRPAGRPASPAEPGQLLLRDPAPAHRPDRLVRSRGWPRRTSPRAGRRWCAGGRPSRRTGPGPGRTPARRTGRGVVPA